MNSERAEKNSVEYNEKPSELPIEEPKKIEFPSPEDHAGPHPLKDDCTYSPEYFTGEERYHKSSRGSSRNG